MLKTLLLKLLLLQLQALLHQLNQKLLLQLQNHLFQQEKFLQKKLKIRKCEKSLRNVWQNLYSLHHITT